MSSDAYTGTENLEVMKEAVNYNRMLIDVVKRHARRGERVLDFGAGVGTFALPMQRDGYAVECVELDDAPRATLAAQGLTVHRTLEGIRDGSVDFVYTLNVLEHIDDDVGALRDIGRTLRDDGRLLVYVPAFPVLFTRMDQRVGHLRRYRRHDLRAKVDAAGFDVLRNDYVDSLGFLATLVYRMTGSRSGAIDRGALRAYDRYVFPMSRRLDLALRHVIGKNLLLTARKRR
jgi:SAM-dependent methyltransferase